LADGAHGTVVRSNQFDLRPGTALQIHVKELLFDDNYLSKVADDKKSFFAQMAVLDPIYHQGFFTANSLGCQPMTSQYFQPLTPQTLALTSAAIYRAMSKYAIGMKAIVMFSQDEYQGTFCPSPVINFTPKATVLIDRTLVGRLIPPLQCNSIWTRGSSIPFSAPQPRLALCYVIMHSIPPPSAFLNSPQCTSVWIVTTVLSSTLLTLHSPPLLALLQ